MKQCASLALLLSLALAACGGETALSFDNQTECGTATIRITDTDTGNIRDYTLDEGDQIEIVIKQGVTYRYEVTYAGREDSALNCEPKSGSVMVPNRGQTSRFTLLSVTPTPAGE